MHSNPLYILIISSVLTGCGGMQATRVPVEDRTALRAASPSQVPPAEVRAAPVRAAPDQAEMLFRVLTAIGVDYRYGGESPSTGFDCSGLVAHVFLQGYGVSLPRNTQAQSKVGEPVALDALKPGDLVFYNTQNRPFSHVGIYLGDGRFVHAPRTGATVRIENLTNTYWSRRWNGARRVAAHL